MPRPTTVPTWDSTAVNVTTPGAEQTVGWGVSQAPSAQVFNWFMHWVYKWVAWLDEREQVLSALPRIRGYGVVSWNFGAPTVASVYNLSGVSTPSTGELLFTFLDGYASSVIFAGGAHNAGAGNAFQAQPSPLGGATGPRCRITDSVTGALVDFTASHGFAHVTFLF